MKMALLVEDHAVFRQALAHLLKQKTGVGHDVQAGSAAEGRWRVGVLDGSIDVAVVDLSLPDADGVDLVREIREREPRVPVVALSERRGDRERVLRASEVGADEVFGKDVSVEDILEAVRRLAAEGRTTTGDDERDHGEARLAAVSERR
jgi:DNA-binding NarL/FixJ family response regulator